MEAALTLSSEVGIKPACESLDIARSWFYRRKARKATPSVEPNPRPSPPRALSLDERQGVLDIFHTDRFVDKAPYEVYATLLDEGEWCYFLVENSYHFRSRYFKFQLTLAHRPFMALSGACIQNCYSNNFLPVFSDQNIIHFNCFLCLLRFPKT